MMANRFHIPEFLVTLEMIDDTRRQFDDVVDRAEKWLISGTKLPMHKKLGFTDQYRLEVLKNQCLRNIANANEVAELKKSDSYVHYSSELKDEIIKKLVQLWKK
ncbi:hypothetical protein PENTCL1PPCAC_23607, partial [Pristionchus entomophagus]